MTPFYLRKDWGSEANICFYFHSPFPSSDVFRMHMHRYDIMNSLLGCDLVGFHLFDFGRNFLALMSALL